MAFHSHLVTTEEEYQKKIKFYEGNDPLSSWMEYLQYLREQKHDVLSTSKRIYDLTKKCIMTFGHQERYRNDERYIRVWIIYADSVSNPKDVFDYMDQHKIGEKCTLFYIGYAWLLESENEYIKADETYEKGIRCGVPSLNHLVQKKEEFYGRSFRLWLQINSNRNAGMGAMYDPHERKNILHFLEQYTSTKRIHGIFQIKPSVFANESTEELRPCFDDTERSLLQISINGKRAIKAHENLSSFLVLQNTEVILCHKDALNTGDKCITFEEFRAGYYNYECPYKETSTKPFGLRCERSNVFKKNISRRLNFSSAEVGLSHSSKFMTPVTDRIHVHQKQKTPDKLQVPSCNYLTPAPIEKKLQWSSSKENRKMGTTSLQSPSSRGCSALKRKRKALQEIISTEVQPLENTLLSGGSRHRSAILDSSMFSSRSGLLDPYANPHRRRTMLSGKVYKCLRSTDKNRALGHAPVFFYTRPLSIKLPSIRKDELTKLKQRKGAMHSVKLSVQRLLKNDGELKRINNICEIYSTIGSGAFATVYLARFANRKDDEPTSFAVKYEKKVHSLPWEFYIVSEFLSRIKSQKKEEREYLPVIDIYSIHLYTDGCLLFMERSEVGTLNDLIVQYRLIGKTIPEEIIIYYTIQMISAVLCFHSCNILHGDIKPDNWLLVRGKFLLPPKFLDEEDETFLSGQVKLIDFGRSLDWQEYLNNGITGFKGDCHVKEFKCIEMLTHKPWTYQIDTFGICGTVHCLLFGEYMKVEQRESTTEVVSFSSEKKWMIQKQFKRYWQTSLWTELFDTIFNRNSTLETLKELRNKFLRYYETNPYKLKATKSFLLTQDNFLNRS